MSSNDLIKEKNTNINQEYTLLTPPLGKGKLHNKFFNLKLFKGAFGEVRKAIHKISGLVRAVKIIKKSETCLEEEEELRNEINVLKKLVNYE